MGIGDLASLKGKFKVKTEAILIFIFNPTVLKQKFSNTFSIKRANNEDLLIGRQLVLFEPLIDINYIREGPGALKFASRFHSHRRYRG